MSPRQEVDVADMSLPAGERVELGDVLFVHGDTGSRRGEPTVQGAKVVGVSMGRVRGKKMSALKYKNKTRYRRKIGHRSTYTRLSIEEIVGSGV